MTSPVRTPRHDAFPEGFEDTLSAQSDKLAIEMAFLTRLVDAMRATATGFLDPAVGDNVTAAYGHMSSPVFERIAQVLERDVPKDAGFGRFRG